MSLTKHGRTPSGPRPWNRVAVRTAGAKYARMRGTVGPPTDHGKRFLQSALFIASLLSGPLLNRLRLRLELDKLWRSSGCRYCFAVPPTSPHGASIPGSVDFPWSKVEGTCDDSGGCCCRCCGCGVRSVSWSLNQSRRSPGCLWRATEGHRLHRVVNPTPSSPPLLQFPPNVPPLRSAPFRCRRRCCCCSCHRSARRTHRSSRRWPRSAAATRVARRRRRRRVSRSTQQ